MSILTPWTYPLEDVIARWVSSLGQLKGLMHHGQTKDIFFKLNFNYTAVLV